MNRKIVHSVFEHIAATFPEHHAIEESSGTSITYRQLNKRAHTIASLLVARGVGRNVLVGVLFPTGITYAATILGVLKAGGLFLPLELGLPRPRLQHILSHTTPSVIVTDVHGQNGLADMLVEFGLATSTILLVFTAAGFHEQRFCDGHWQTTAIADAEATDPLPMINEPDDSCYVIYTSGSTGVPKFIEGWHKGLAHYCHWQATEFGLNETSRISQMAPVTFEASLKDFFVALCCGATLCIPAADVKENPARLIEWIESSALTLLQTVPSYLRLITREAASQARSGGFFPSLQLVFQSGDTLYGKDVNHWRHVIGTHAELVNLYGPAEVTLLKTFHRIPPEPLKPNEIVPIGKPITNTVILILSGHTLCPPGKIGEIAVKSPFIVKGYYRSPELTAEKFVQNPLQNETRDIVYRTGDLGRYRPDMTIDFVGRLDSQVKVYGNRIELAEIESVLLAMPQIGQAVVVPHRTDEMENVLACYYTELEPISHTALREHILASLPDYMVPAYFIPMASLPLSLNGKVDRKALPKPEVLVIGSYEAPVGTTEIQLAEIWGEILGLKRIGRANPFMEIGGDSLKAIRIIARMYKVFSVEVSVRDFFASPTIGALATFIDRARHTHYEPIPALPDAASYPLSHAQRRLWMLDQMEKGSAAYTMASAFVIEGSFSLAAFTQAIHTLHQRHETLRTTFIAIDGVPRQKIETATTPQITVRDVSHTPDPEHTAREYFTTEAARPFDLTTGPLYRIALLTLAPQRTAFVFSIHHIISDVWSLGVMTAELSTLYNGFRTGQTPHLPPLPIQYRDFAAWQNQKVNDPATLQRDRTYWLQQLAAPLPVLDLPADFPRPPVKTYAGAVVHFTLDPAIAQPLRALATAQGASLFALLIALVRVLMFRYTAQEDLIIGTPVAGRVHPDLEPQIGFFLNTLALRDQVRADDRFCDLLMRVMATNTAGFDHQNYPFDQLVDELELLRDVSRSPLFDLMVVLQNAGQIPFTLDGATVRELTQMENISKFDLDFVFQENDDTIDVIVEYNRDLFVPQRIHNMAHHFCMLAEGVVVNSTARVSDLPLLTTAELQWIHHDFNATTAPWPQQATLVSLFTEQVQRTPNTIAVRFEDQHLSYADLQREAERIAALLQQYRIEAGSIVAILAEPALHMPAWLLGILHAGCTYLPIDPTYPAERIRFMLEDSQAALVLAQGHLLATHSAIALQGITAEAIIERTAPRAQILDVDALPVVNRALIDHTRYHRFIGQSMVKHAVAIQATRGCPYQCAYCHQIWPRNHVYRSAENIFAEVQALYQLGVRRFVFIDDIFNLNRDNSRRFFELILEHGLQLQIHFPNGLRGDLLTPDYIDLMVAAGTVSFALALETASPRLQTMIGKNLNLDRFRDTLQYITTHHPQVILELFTMHGFPSETEAEALATLEFMQSIHWLHFPYVHILKIFPGSAMEQLALDNGIDGSAIRRSHSLAFHELPETLPFDAAFTKQYQSEFFQGYFLNRERLRHVLPHQMRVLTEDELVQKYNSYLPLEIHSFAQLLEFFGIPHHELGDAKFLLEDSVAVPELSHRFYDRFPRPAVPEKGALRIVLLDLSQLFSEHASLFYDVVEPPLGLMSLLSYLQQQFGSHIDGRIAKARIDFDSFAELRQLLDETKPELIGIRTLSLYQEFFHETVALLRQWGIEVPIIAGGPYATSSVAHVLQNRAVDLVVIGEGEATLAELVGMMLRHEHRLPDEAHLRALPGIAFVPRAAQKQAYAGTRPLVRLEPEHSPTPNNCVVHPPQLDPSAAAYLLYTSGSTGTPKGVLVEHRNVVRLLFNDRMPFDFSSRDVWVQSHSFCFDFSVWEMYGALLRGGTLVIPKRDEVRDIARYVTLVKNSGVTVLNQTPAAFYGFIDEALRTDFDWSSSLRYVIFGGDRLEPTYLRRWAERFPSVALINMYGITETTVHVTFHQLSLEELAIAGKSPIGTPIPETTVYVCDASMNLLPVGIPGEFYVGGSGVSRGYLNRPELQNQRFITNPFGAGKLYRTGDLGRWTWTGGLEYLGRNDQQVQIRGFRVELGEIESRLLAHPAIRECVVLALTSTNDTLELAAWLVFEHEVTIAALRDHLAQTLADYMIPAWFTPIDALPLTANGKLDRRALPDPREAHAPSLDLGTTLVAPRNDTEQIVATVWEGVLGRSAIGIHDNYFALGGDSIRAIQVISRLQQQGWQAEMIDVFQFPTVAGLASRITPYERVIDQKPVTGNVTLSPVQRWFFETHGAGVHHYNQSILLTSRERLDGTKLRTLLSALVAHHDMLRTAFTQSIDGWRQTIQPIGTPLRFEIVDFTGATHPAQALEQHAAALQASFDIAQPPLLTAALYQLPDGDRLCLIIHHLVVDGVSWRILAEDVVTGYRQLVAGKPLALTPKSDSFAAWMVALQTYATSDTLQRERPYWQHIAERATTIAPLPFGTATPTAVAADFDDIAHTLPLALTDQLLRHANRAYATDAVDLLLTATALALTDWSGSRCHLITLEGHGREEIGVKLDVSRTVGWFTTLFPHLLEVSERDDSGYRVRVVKEGMRAIPHHGIGYGVLRWLTPNAAHDATLPSLPRISFNYLGVFDATVDDGAWTLSDEPHGSTVGGDSISPFDLEITGAVVGEALRIALRYNRHALEEKVAKRLLQQLVNHLHEIIAHCCQVETTVITPSDISYDGLDIDQLDTLLESLGDS